MHRLDRDTSGALAFALSPAARSALRALFRAHRMERRYAGARARRAAARTRARSTRPSTTPTRAAGAAWRGRASPRPRAHALARASSASPRGALLEVELETGRQHQIRLHLAHVGLPIVGDPVYGRLRPRRTVTAPRQMLHARQLALRPSR